MESYDDFFRNAKVYTQVHAKPSQAQLRLIDQHYAAHYKMNSKEEQKQQQNQ